MSKEQYLYVSLTGEQVEAIHFASGFLKRFVDRVKDFPEAEKISRNLFKASQHLAEQTGRTRYAATR